MDSLASTLLAIFLAVSLIATDCVHSAPVTGQDFTRATSTQPPIELHKIDSEVASKVKNETEGKDEINEEKVSYKEFEMDNGGSVEINPSPDTEKTECDLSDEEVRRLAENFNSVEEIVDYLYRTKDYQSVACLFRDMVTQQVMSEAKANEIESEVVRQLWTKLQNVVVVQDGEERDYLNPDYQNNELDYDYKIVQKIFDQGIEELLYELLYSLYRGSITGDGDQALGNFVRLIASEVATNGISPVEGKELIDYIFSDRLTTPSLPEEKAPIPTEHTFPEIDETEVKEEIEHDQTDEIEQELQKEVQSNSQEQGPTDLVKQLGGANINMQQLFQTLRDLSPKELYELKEQIDTQSYENADEEFRNY